MARFRITKDSVLLLEVDLKQDTISLGRGPENDIRLGDLTVSRVHARVSRTPEGRFAIADAESTNGIYLNGHRLAQPTVLTDGDVLGIGAYQLEFADSNELATLRLEASRLTSQAFVHQERPLLAAGNAGAAVLINEANNAMFAITSGKAVIGNEGAVDIRVPGSEGVRASIMQQGAQFYICSETEQPCVKVNGTPVMNALLVFNDRLEVGSRRFIFREI
jgi:pSer/pThr/pTyr-binding forkhead associated (FHA) protein